MELQQENKMGVMPVNKLLLSMSLPDRKSTRLNSSHQF